MEEIRQITDRVTILRDGRVVETRPTPEVSLDQVVQWMVVMPEVSLQTWFSFLAVLLVISRIPLLPSRDLIFVGAGIELSRFLDVPPAPIAGMLLVQSVLDKLLNLVLFTLLSRADRDAAPLDAPQEAS